MGLCCLYRISVIHHLYRHTFIRVTESIAPEEKDPTITSVRICEKTYVQNRIQLLFGTTWLVMMVLVAILYLFSSIIVSLGEDQVPVHAYFIFLHIITVFLVFFFYVRVVSDLVRNVRYILFLLFLLLFIEIYFYFEISI